MISFIFGFALFLYLIQAAYFLWRYRQNKRPGSLLCAFNVFGWATVFARELHLLPRPPTSVVLAAAFSVGLAALLILARNEGFKPSKLFRWPNS